MARAIAPASLGLALSALLTGTAMAQQDPGVRGGAAGSGQPIGGLSAPESTFFETAKSIFNEADGVDEGLGPRFNLDSCGGCHTQPAIGGSSPAHNPQVDVAHAAGATNVIPPFITPTGPVREARFPSDGGVHDLFTIQGRSDAPAGCTIAQPDFATELGKGNVIFRIPTPVFGAGLVEATPDETLIADAAAMSARRQALKIGGKFNHHKRTQDGFQNNGNDGTISRFGWKAQNKSMSIFAGEAYNVEQGVTNELFPNERQGDPSCLSAAYPEDHTNVATGEFSDLTFFIKFMELLDAPIPVPSQSADNGRVAFVKAGCDACHIPSHKAGPSDMVGISNVVYFPYTDFQIHDMGKGLADDIPQGEASGSEFRTAPLWGVGQRIFFLHDGRTSDLLQAIQAHNSPQSEANRSVGLFNSLAPIEKQDLLNFLRSL